MVYKNSSFGAIYSLDYDRLLPIIIIIIIKPRAKGLGKMGRGRGKRSQNFYYNKQNRRSFKSCTDVPMMVIATVDYL